MFYIKQKNGDVLITHHNAFTKCPRCGKEVQVDILDFVLRDPRDLMGIELYCDKCKEAMKDIIVKNNHEEIFVFDEGRQKLEF